MRNKPSVKTLDTRIMTRYGVGTSETGSFTIYDTLKEAQTEAQDWANSNPGVTVLIWALNEHDEVLDTVADYCNRPVVPNSDFGANKGTY